MEMDIKNFTSAVTQLAEEKDIPKKKVIEIIEAAIAAAYKKEYGERGQVIRTEMDPKTGEIKFFQLKTVVDDSMILSDEDREDELEDTDANDEEPKKVRYNPERHLMIEDASKIKEDAKVGDEIEIALEPKQSYGRIAAQTAKQVILQRSKKRKER